MKWVVGLFALVTVATIATVGYVILNERDTVPDRLAECAEDAGARQVVRADSLGPMRVDLLQNELLVGDTVGLSNGYRVVYLRPSDDTYDTIVLQRPDQFRLRPTAIIPDRPSTFPFVAFAQGDEARAELLACVDEARAGLDDPPGTPR